MKKTNSKSLRQLIESDAGAESILNGLKAEADATVAPPANADGSGIRGSNQYPYDLSTDKVVNAVVESTVKRFLKEADEDPFEDEETLEPVSAGASDGMSENEDPEEDMNEEDTAVRGDEDVYMGDDDHDMKESDELGGEYIEDKDLNEDEDETQMDKLPKDILPPQAERYLKAMNKYIRESVIRKYSAAKKAGAKARAVGGRK